MRSLILSPSSLISSPSSWLGVSDVNFQGRFDEVHCTGGGSLLLYLLCCARRAPRLTAQGRVIFHGELVYPTFGSVSKWLHKIGLDELIEDECEWRQAAVSLGVGGDFHKKQHQWIEPIKKSVFMGRTHELVAHFDDLMTRSKQNGRLDHVQEDRPTEDVLDDHARSGVLLCGGDTAFEEAPDMCSLILQV